MMRRRVFAGLFGLWPGFVAAATFRVPEDHATIQAAIDSASDGDTVLVGPGTYDVRAPIVFRGKAVEVKSVAGPETTTVRMTEPVSPARGSVFAFEDAETEGSALVGFTIADGKGMFLSVPASPGGGSRTIFFGGGVYCGPHASPSVMGNVFRANSAEYGAALGCDVEAQPRLRGNDFLDNSASSGSRKARGGALACLADSVVEVEGGLFARNRADDGGAVYLGDGGSITVQEVRFEENRASDDGGAILARGDGFVIRNSTFVGNQCEDEGGALTVRSDSPFLAFVVTGSLFERNAARSGGALFIEATTREPSPLIPVVDNTRFVANHADLGGGGAFVFYDTDGVEFRKCSFERNRASSGGGVFVDYEAAAKIVESTLRGNRATFGGGVFADESYTTTENCVLSDNVAEELGGAIWADSGLTVDHATISGNVAALGGGVFTYLDFSIRNSILWGNAGTSLVAFFGPLPPDFPREIHHSVIQTETVLPGVGNINLDPRFGAWGTRAEVHVDAASPAPGDGSPGNPYRNLTDAVAGYDFRLALDSPCVGTAEDAKNMGADLGLVAAAGETKRRIRLERGAYDVSEIHFAHQVSLEGEGPLETVLLGSVMGLRSEATLSGVTVTRGLASGIYVSAEESPRIENTVVRGNYGGLAGGIACREGSAPSIRHVTVSGNAGLEAGGLYSDLASVTVSSSIIAGNAGPAIYLREGLTPQVTFSCIEAEATWPGEGNTPRDPRFGGWETKSEVHVDASNPGPGDGTPGDPYRSLADAFAGYSLALAPDSPCVGTGEGGTDMGANTGVLPLAGEPARTVHLAAGNYEVRGLTLAHRVSIVGQGDEQTVLEGTVLGLRSGAELSGVTVTGGSRGGVTVSPREGPKVEDVSIVGNAVLFSRTALPLLSFCGSPMQNSYCGGGRTGGGVYCGKASQPEFRRAVIEGNLADQGAAIFCATDSRPRFDACRIRGNEARNGGVVASFSALPTLLNCLVTGNRALLHATVFAQTTDTGRPLISYSTFAGNFLPDQREVFCRGAGPRLQNSIIHTTRFPPDGLVCGDVSNTLINADPGFVRHGTFDFHRVRVRKLGERERLLPDFVVEPGDYHLSPDSPALGIGSGDDLPDADLEGNPRPCGSGLDIGAFEFCDGPTPFRRGDPNADGEPNIADPVAVLFFLFQGGAPPDCLDSADVDDSGVVDLSDAIYLLNHLFLGGPVPPDPHPACGLDLTPSQLTCLHYPSC